MFWKDVEYDREACANAREWHTKSETYRVWNEGDNVFLFSIYDGERLPTVLQMDVAEARKYVSDIISMANDAMITAVQISQYLDALNDESDE